MTSKKSVIPSERIEKAIYLIRGEKVMFDFDLSSLYGVETIAFLMTLCFSLPSKSLQL